MSESDLPTPPEYSPLELLEGAWGILDTLLEWLDSALDELSTYQTILDQVVDKVNEDDSGDGSQGGGESSDLAGDLMELADESASLETALEEVTSAIRGLQHDHEIELASLRAEVGEAGSAGSNATQLPPT